MLPFNGFLIFPDAPQFFTHWGLWLAAGLVLLGSETAAVLAAFLAGIGILVLPDTAAAIWLSALAADFAWFTASRIFPNSELVRRPLKRPLIALHRTGLPEKLPAIVFYRFFPVPKSALPVREAIEAPRSLWSTASLFFSGTLLWSLAAFAVGLTFAWISRSWCGSLVPIWLKLPGFLLLFAVIFPMLRYILWFEFEKWQRKLKKGIKP